MSYKSKIRILTTTRGYATLSKFVEDYLVDLHKEDDNLLKNPLLDTKVEIDNQVYFGWDWIEWSDDSDGADAILAGLEYLSDLDLSYEYVRVGEDITDLEHDYYESEDDPLKSYDFIDSFLGCILRDKVNKEVLL